MDSRTLWYIKIVLAMLGLNCDLHLYVQVFDKYMSAYPAESIVRDAGGTTVTTTT